MMRQDVKQLSYLSRPPWGHQDGRGVLEEQEEEKENFLEDVCTIKIFVLQTVFYFQSDVKGVLFEVLFFNIGPG